jgi:hypothetical protein
MSTLFRNSCRSVGEPAITAVIIIAIVGVIVLFSKAFSDVRPKKFDSKFSSKMKDLVSRSKRLHVTSGQDQNALFCLIHANQARTKLETARELVSDAELSDMTGIDIVELGNRISEREKNAMRRLAMKAPSIVTKDASIGGSWS